MIYYHKEVSYKITARGKVRRTSIMKNEQYKEAVNSLVRHIQDADAIVVGAASGMSAAAGFRHSFDGFYYRYRTSEERWAFIARNLCMILDAETGQPYYDLHEILKDENYYILTTNQDTQFTRVFPKEKISAIQGDWRFLQCSRRCHDELYSSVDTLQKLKSAGSKEYDSTLSKMWCRNGTMGSVLDISGREKISRRIQ